MHERRGNDDRHCHHAGTGCAAGLVAQMNRVAAEAPQPFGGDAPGPEHSSASTPRGQSPVPAALLLAVIPLLVFGGPIAVSRPTPTPVPAEAGIVPSLVATEGVRMIRMDANTFRARWRPLYDVPPATVIHEVTGGDAHSQANTGKPVDVAANAVPRPPAVRIVKRAALRQDICSRHGMRRVTYSVRGYQHWRCRR